jgi:hypothetical protein
MGLKPVAPNPKGVEPNGLGMLSKPVGIEDCAVSGLCVASSWRRMSSTREPALPGKLYCPE